MKIVDVHCPNAVGIVEPTDDRIKVPAVRIEIDRLPHWPFGLLRGEKYASAFSRQ